MNDNVDGLISKLPESPMKILNAIVENPNITIREFGKQTNLSERMIKNHLTLLKGTGLINCVGSNYNLDAIISVGYRVNSTRTTQFRQWCTFVLRQFAIRGDVIE